MGSIKYTAHDVDPDSVRKDARFPKPKDPAFPVLVEIVLRDPETIDDDLVKRLEEEKQNFARIYQLLKVI